jgi:hypothetical protein
VLYTSLLWIPSGVFPFLPILSAHILFWGYEAFLSRLM